MRTLLLGFCLAAGAAIGAEVRLGGPVLGYVVDREGGLRPLQGVLGAATVGEVLREGVRDVSGQVLLLADGSAAVDGRLLEGAWEKLDRGVLIDGTGLRILAGAAAEARAIGLNSRVLRAASSNGAVAALSEDGTLRVFGSSGEARFQMELGVFWSFAFVPGSEALVAYDPAANELVRIAESGAVHAMQKLPGAGTKYEIGADAGSGAVVLLHVESGRCLIVQDGATREMQAPEGAAVVESLPGRGVLLHRDAARPLWILDTSREEPLVAIPALRAREEVAQ